MFSAYARHTMTDANLHKRLNALGCPQKGRPDDAGQVVWDNSGDLFGDGFKIVLRWNANGLDVSERFRAAGSDEDAPVWSFRWLREDRPDGRSQWHLDSTAGVALEGITSLEKTVVFAREAIRRVGVAPRWTDVPLDASPSLSAPPGRKGPSC